MFGTIKLSKAEIQELVNAHTAANQAKLKLETLKKKYLSGIKMQTFVEEGIGAIIVNTFEKNEVDTKKLKEENPELVNKYRILKEQTTVTIKNYTCVDN